MEASRECTSASGIRVASLLPSATEMLCAIGGEALLVGRSHEDNYPESITDRPILTQTKLQGGLTSAQIDQAVSSSIGAGDSLYAILADELQRLQPTVILTQDLCKVCSVSPSDVNASICKLDPAPEVLCFNPFRLEDILEDMIRLGKAVGLLEEAKAVVQKLEKRIEKVRSYAADHPTSSWPKVAFLEWAEPVYVGGHWTPELVSIAGGQHILNNAGHKSFRVSKEDVIDADPDMLVLCPCGLPFQQTVIEACSAHCQWLRELRAIKAGNAAVVDGDAMFNRPGPRLVEALEWLAFWMHSSEQSAVEFRTSSFPWQTWPQKDATGVVPDIEDFHAVHTAAVKRGDVTYMDPATGYQVFTELYMIQRGWCCGSGCRHCPYGHFNLKEHPRTAKIQAPRLLGTQGRSGCGTGPIIAWNGPHTPAMPGSTVCLVFDNSYAAVSEDKTGVHVVMDWAQANDVELLAVPVGQLQDALALVQPTEWRVGAELMSKETWLDTLHNLTAKPYV